MKFELPDLPYKYDALEPWIDVKTMEIHHGRHHKTYTDKFNTTIEKYPELFHKKAEDLLKDLAALPEDIRNGVKNNGGGFVNHSFFWTVIEPGKEQNIPSGQILEKIKEAFESFDEFKKQFSDSALNRFGSGWTWLVSNKSGELAIMSTQNQDSPLSIGLKPILCIDVWEHAYYLKYQNKRAEYIEAFFHLINWEKVEQLYLENII